MTCDVAVIGGGAAGMMAALTAALRGLDVALVEPNSMLGRKVRITGKGRCNLTNNCDLKDFLRNVPRNPKFLYSSLSAFSPSDTMSFFEEIGLPLKTERGNRVFPVSDIANDVADALTRELRSAGVTIIREKVRRIAVRDGAVSAVKVQSGMVNCSAAIICTGGCSYTGTGSTGDGLRIARELGHKIITTRPSLVPLTSPDEDCSELMGLSLRNVSLRVFEDGENIYSDFGEMLFTHFGVSGPLVLSASAHMRRFDDSDYSIEIDLKPALDEESLDKRVLSDFEKFRNSDFINSLNELLPKKLIPVVVRRSGIDPRVKVHSITREQRRELVRLIKAFPVSINGTRPIDEAIVTTGGVDVMQIDPRTMQSKLVSGLYFAGEVIDVDAYTGGYNLQIAWSTGRMAGNKVLV